MLPGLFLLAPISVPGPSVLSENKTWLQIWIVIISNLYTTGTNNSTNSASHFEAHLLDDYRQHYYWGTLHTASLMQSRAWPLFSIGGDTIVSVLSVITFNSKF